MSFKWFVAAFIAAGVILGAAAGVLREIATSYGATAARKPSADEMAGIHRRLRQERAA